MNKNTFKKGNNNNYEKEVDGTSKKRNRSISKKEIKTVYEKDTKELEKVLKNKSKSDFDLNEFFEEEEIAHRDYFTYISDLIYKNGFTKEQIYVRANVNRNYGRKILGGETGMGLAKRDLIIRIAYVANFKLIEVNRALKLAGLSELYVKEPKDAALICAFNKDSSTRDLDELNEYMRECGFETFD